MKVKNLKLDLCQSFEPEVFNDSRGSFFEWFQSLSFEKESGKKFELAQANISVSAKGVLRGIHFANFPPGQAKYVTCVAGSVVDVMVDLRLGSDSFGEWEAVLLDSRNPKMIYIPSGIGHAFMALEENTTFIYLCDQSYNPLNEFEIDPFDSDIGIEWPKDITPLLSKKDESAPKLNEILDRLPRIEELI